MFTVFIDDSGTDPNQKVAIASALVIPSDSLIALEEDWNRLKARREFKCFHASTCVAGNTKEGFGGWGKCRIKRLVAGVRHLTKKYGVKIISYAVNKSDYDEVMPSEMKAVGGQYHYTWAIRYVIDQLDNWALDVGYKEPFLYLFDWMDPQADREERDEVDAVMAQKESDSPGRYQGHYDFKKRCDFPGLQCADLAAWSCYQMALFAFRNKPMNPIASKTFWNFHKFKRSKEWLFAVTQNRYQLEKWAKEQMSDPELNRIRREWLERHRLRKKPV